MSALRIHLGPTLVAFLWPCSSLRPMSFSCTCTSDLDQAVFNFMVLRPIFLQGSHPSALKSWRKEVRQLFTDTLGFPLVSSLCSLSLCTAQSLSCRGFGEGSKSLLKCLRMDILGFMPGLSTRFICSRPQNPPVANELCVPLIGRSWLLSCMSLKERLCLVCGLGHLLLLCPHVPCPHVLVTEEQFTCNSKTLVHYILEAQLYQS